MNIAENFHPRVPEAAFGFVRMMWPTHNPSQIAACLNTKYGLAGAYALDYRAIENMHLRIASLDREMAEG